MREIRLCMIFAGISLLTVTGYAQSQKKYYYSFDEKKHLNEVSNKVVLRFDEKYFSEMQNYFQRNEQFNIEEDLDHYGCFVLTTTEGVNVKVLMEDFKKLYGIKSVNPVYILTDFISPEMYTTDEFVVQFKENVSQKEIDEMHKKYNVEVKDIDEFRQLLSVPIKFDVFEVANAYQTSGLVVYSCPNFISKIESFQATLPTDPYFYNQFYLRNTGQTVNGFAGTNGADINILNAWGITKGNSNIAIAVIDRGITSNHPDLPNTRQIRINGSNFGGVNVNDPSPIGDENHGNACAGIIAATHNNEGIAGVAPDCKIMPIRLDRYASYDDFANAIRFAWYNGGADIISCSLGTDSDDPNFHASVMSVLK